MTNGAGGASPKEKISLVPGSQILHVEVSSTRSAHQGGLQESADVGDGMLFEYAYPTRAPFWMKNTYVPLTIAFFDVQGRIMGWFDATAQDHRAITPPGPYRMVLEVPTGRVDFTDSTQLRRNNTRNYFENLVGPQAETEDEPVLVDERQVARDERRHARLHPGVQDEE